MKARRSWLAGWSEGELDEDDEDLQFCEFARRKCRRKARVEWEQKATGFRVFRCDQHPPRPMKGWVGIRSADPMCLLRQLGHPELWG